MEDDIAGLAGGLVVDSIPDGVIHDYRYIGGQFVLDEALKAERETAEAEEANTPSVLEMSKQLQEERAKNEELKQLVYALVGASDGDNIETVQNKALAVNASISAVSTTGKGVLL